MYIDEWLVVFSNIGKTGTHENTGVIYVKFKVRTRRSTRKKHGLCY
jgi:hypothetical protein